MRTRIAILLVSLLLGSTIQDARSQGTRALIRETYNEKGKPRVSLEVIPLLGHLPPSGYHPIRVRIVNDEKVSHTWVLAFTSSDSGVYGNQMSQLRSSFPVTCDSQSVAEVDLLVPVATFLSRSYGSSTTSTLEINVRAPASFPASRETIDTEFHPDWPSVLCSETIHSLNGNALDKETETFLSGTGGRHAGNQVEFGGSFNPKTMPDDWRAYSGHDACLMTENDWNNLPAGARNALKKWNRLGGALLIYTTSSATDLNSLGLAKDSAGESDRDLSWGTVRLRDFPDNELLEAKDTVLLVRDSIDHIGGHRAGDLRSSFQSGWPLQDTFGQKSSHVALFIIVLILFGILVGPVNLFVFARSGKRHKLFVSTPLISLGASLLLVALILLQDGFGGRGQRLVLHEVGPDNTAYVSQEQIARTGVLLRTGFTTSEHGYLSPVRLSNSRWARVTADNGGGNGRYNLELETSGIKATGDWFKSRSEHGNLFETIRPSRERINLVRDPGPPTINSTFNFPLDEIFFRDTSGQLWKGTDVQQGRNLSLSPCVEQEFKNWLDNNRKRFSKRNRSRLDLISEHRGYFFASTTSADGVSTLRNLRWEETFTILTGQVPTGN